MNLTGMIHLFLFPGMLFAIPAGWFFVWGEHKAVARMQRRIGPPLLQPFYDFVKLTGKSTPSRHGIEADLLRLYPAISVLSLIGAIALLPVIPDGRGFSGDGILMVALLELPSVCFILAGFTSGSIFGEIGAIREAVLSVANNLVFLLAIVSVAVTKGTFSLSELAAPVRPEPARPVAPAPKIRQTKVVAAASKPQPAAAATSAASPPEDLAGAPAQMLPALRLLGKHLGNLAGAGTGN